jgi:hypothetical protein
MGAHGARPRNESHRLDGIFVRLYIYAWAIERARIGIYPCNRKDRSFRNGFAANDGVNAPLIRHANRTRIDVRDRFFKLGAGCSAPFTPFPGP